jgi:hypothetical protein
MTKEFTLLEILGITSGYLLTESFDRLHELIEWVLGVPVFSHQIPSIASIVKTKMIEQFPQFDLEKNHSLNADIQLLVINIRARNVDAASVLKCNATITTIIERMQTKYGIVFLVKKGNQ